MSDVEGAYSLLAVRVSVVGYALGRASLRHWRRIHPVVHLCNTLLENSGLCYCTPPSMHDPYLLLI